MYNIETQTFLNGKIVYSKEFYSNPQLFANYPTQHNIDSLLQYIRENQIIGIYYCVRIYETGVFVIASNQIKSRIYPVSFS